MRAAGCVQGRLPQAVASQCLLPFALSHNHAPHPSPLPFPVQEEYALRQAAIKAEPLEIIYSYYNGTGHRRAITVSVAGGRVGRSALHARLTYMRGWAASCWLVRAGLLRCLNSGEWGTLHDPGVLELHSLPPAQRCRGTLPATHRVQVRKGDTVGQFLKAVVEQLMPQFREMRCGGGGQPGGQGVGQPAWTAGGTRGVVHAAKRVHAPLMQRCSHTCASAPAPTLQHRERGQPDVREGGHHPAPHHLLL